jgi:hypothetical protein
LSEVSSDSAARRKECPHGLDALDTFFLAYPSKRYRSAGIGIAVHSAQSVVLAILIVTLVI